MKKLIALQIELYQQIYEAIKQLEEQNKEIKPLKTIK